MSRKAADPLDALADDGRTKVSDMQWFGNVRSAVIDNDLNRIGFRLIAEFIRVLHFVQIPGQKISRNVQIDESRFDGLCLGKAAAVFQKAADLLRDLDRRLMRFLCQGHGPVALVLAKIRPVRDRGRDLFRIVSRFFKRALQFFRDQI